jgi:undecaprenyl pyrophosphate synthase
MASDNVEKEIAKAISNIGNDRALTKTLLNDIMEYLSVSKERHIEVGTVAAKYVETLQRSNEQLVKLVGIMHKKTTTDNGLSLRDKEDLFDMIQENKENVE